MLLAGSRRRHRRLEHTASVSRKAAPQPHHRCCSNRRQAKSTQEKSTAALNLKLKLKLQVVLTQTIRPLRSSLAIAIVIMTQGILGLKQLPEGYNNINLEIFPTNDHRW